MSLWVLYWLGRRRRGAEPFCRGFFAFSRLYFHLKFVVGYTYLRIVVYVWFSLVLLAASTRHQYCCWLVREPPNATPTVADYPSHF